MISKYSQNFLAAAIRARRQSMRISQQALADRAGVSRRSIMRYEKGEISSVSGLFAVAEVLNINLDELTYESNSENSKPEKYQ